LINLIIMTAVFREMVQVTKGKNFTEFNSFCSPSQQPFNLEESLIFNKSDKY
jgi:hypothetical protein